MNVSKRQAARVAVVLCTAALLRALPGTPAQAACPPGEDCGDIYMKNPIGATTTVAPPPNSGSFTVTVEGFHVIRKTHDTWFDWDGKADEVFHKTRVNAVDPSGNAVGTWDRTNFLNGRAVMGDTNRFYDRIQAGTASDRGGIESGNTINVRFPYIENYRLVKDGNKLVFTISLNEWDHPGTDWSGQWLDLVNAHQAPIARAAAAYNPSSAGAVTTLAGLGTAAVQMLNDLSPDSGSRPIGTVQTASGSRYYTYDAPVVVLDYAKATELAATNTWLGQGVFEIGIEDRGNGDGHYILRLKVTRQP